MGDPAFCDLLLGVDFDGIRHLVVLLGWCYADAEDRMIPITQFLGLALLAVSIIGVPWYFIRNRGLLCAAKRIFGFGLFCLYGATFLPTYILCELIADKL